MNLTRNELSAHAEWRDFADHPAYADHWRSKAIALLRSQGWSFDVDPEDVSTASLAIALHCASLAAINSDPSPRPRIN